MTVLKLRKTILCTTDFWTSCQMDGHLICSYVRCLIWVCGRWMHKLNYRFLSKSRMWAQWNRYFGKRGRIVGGDINTSLRNRAKTWRVPSVFPNMDPVLIYIHAIWGCTMRWEERRGFSSHVSNLAPSLFAGLIFDLHILYDVLKQVYSAKRVTNCKAAFFASTSFLSAVDSWTKNENYGPQLLVCNSIRWLHCRNSWKAIVTVAWDNRRIFWLLRPS